MECLVCRGAMEATPRNRVYCSPKCYAAGSVARKRMLRRAKPTRQALCAHCSSPFIAKRKSHFFCSKECNYRHTYARLMSMQKIRRRQKTAADNAALIRFCLRCNLSIPPSKNKQAKYCSDECASMANHSKRYRRIVSCAQAFDVLVKLLEKSDVDEKTKEAIGRLREFIEGERPETGLVYRVATSPADQHDG